MKGALGLLGVASVAGFAVPCRAAAAPLSLSMSECGSLSEAALREHLSLELATLGLSDAAVDLRLRCSSGVVEVQAGGGAAPSSTRVALQDTERGARERLVALAASELVAQMERVRRAERARAERERAAAAASVRVTPAPAGEPEREALGAAPRESRRELSAAASAVSLGAPRVALWGASLGARLGFGARWSLLLDSRFERGTDALTLADVRWTSLSGLVGAGASLRRGSLELSAALGVRAGWLSWAAAARAPDEGRKLTAPWAGIALPLRAAWGSDLRPFFGVEAGYVTLPVRGNVSSGEALVEHRGAWLSASLGVAVAL